MAQRLNVLLHFSVTYSYHSTRGQWFEQFLIQVINGWKFFRNFNTVLFLFRQGLGFVCFFQNRKISLKAESQSPEDQIWSGNLFISNCYRLSFRLDSDVKKTQLSIVKLQSHKLNDRLGDHWKSKPVFTFKYIRTRKLTRDICWRMKYRKILKKSRDWKLIPCHCKRHCMFSKPLFILFYFASFLIPCFYFVWSKGGPNVLTSYFPHDNSFF